MPFPYSTWVFFKFVALIIDHLGTNTTHYLQTNCVLCNHELWFVYKHHLFFEYVSSCCFLLLLAFLFIGTLCHPPLPPQFPTGWSGHSVSWGHGELGVLAVGARGSTLLVYRDGAPWRFQGNAHWNDFDKKRTECCYHVFFLRRCCRERWIDRDIEVHWFDVDLDDLL